MFNVFSKNRVIVLVSAAAVLTGCGELGGVDYEATSSASVSSANTVNVSLSSEVNSSIGSDTTVGIVAYAAGASGSRARALSGSRDVNVGAAVTSGTATYSGDLGFALADEQFGTSTTSTNVSFATTRGIDITLTADFDAGTLDGDIDSSAALVSLDVDVDGTISGQDLDGTVEIDFSDLTGASPISIDVETDLSGSIGADGAVGTFHGTDATSAVAGGFVVTRD